MEELQCYVCGTHFNYSAGLIYCPSCYNSVSIGPPSQKAVDDYKERHRIRHLSPKAKQKLQSVDKQYHRFRNELNGRAEREPDLRRTADWASHWVEWFEEAMNTTHKFQELRLENDDYELVGLASNYAEEGYTLAVKILGSVVDKLKSMGNL